MKSGISSEGENMKTHGWFVSDLQLIFMHYIQRDKLDEVIMKPKSKNEDGLEVSIL